MSEVAGEEEAIGTEFPVALPLEEERAKVRAEVFRWHWRGYAVQAADLPQMREVRIKIRFPRQHREMRASLGPTQRMQGARVNFAGQREAQLVVGPRCHRVRDFAHTRHPSSSYALYCRTPWLLPLRPLALRLRSALNTPHFQDDTQARQHLEAVRWPDGPVCPHCGSAERPYQLQGKAHRPGLWKCVDCREQFTVTVGTPFERSKVPLSKWLMAAYLLCSSRKGISARQLQRTLGVTYKTAWRMAHRIHEAMLQQNPHLVPTALWLQWILLGEQKRRNQDEVVVTQ